MRIILKWGSLVGLLLVAALGAAGCDRAVDDAGERPLVVVTTTILGDVVGVIGGEDVTVEVLMPVGADPHEFEASARQAARIRDAALVVYNGLDLEEGLLDVIDAAEGVRRLEVGPALDPLPYSDGGTTVLDPHVWMDPLRMADAADLVAAALDEVGDGGFAARAAQYRSELESLSAEIDAAIATIPADRRTLVTNHFALGYYADRYGLELIGTVIPAATTGAEPSAADFAALVDLIRTEDVPAIFGSTDEPTRLAEAVAAEVGRDVDVVTLYTGSLGEPGSGAETYLDMMRTTTGRIVEALGGADGS